MGKRHAVNSNNHPVALFARGISGLAGVFRELKALEKSPPHSAVVLEWEIPLHELARYEHVECVCRHLCLIKRHTLPQLVVNVNVLGVNSVADEAQVDWLVHLSQAKTFQIVYLNVSVQAFQVRFGATPVHEALDSLGADLQLVRVFAGTSSLSKACKFYGKRRITAL